MTRAVHNWGRKISIYRHGRGETKSLLVATTYCSALAAGGERGAARAGRVWAAGVVLTLASWLRKPRPTFLAYNKQRHGKLFTNFALSTKFMVRLPRISRQWTTRLGFKLCNFTHSSGRRPARWRVGGSGGDGWANSRAYWRSSLRKDPYRKQTSILVFSTITYVKMFRRNLFLIRRYPFLASTSAICRAKWHKTNLNFVLFKK